MNGNWKKRFYTVWIGQAFSLLGSSLVDFALIWWLTEKTGSETILALSSLTAIVPTMLLGPFAGALIDKFSRRRVMILADGGIALVTVCLLTAFLTGQEQVWMFFAVLFLRSLGSAFHKPAMLASTTLMVPGDQLTRVGGMNRILQGAMHVVAPVLGAMLISLFDVESVLMIDILTASAAVGTLLFVSIPDPETGESVSHVWRDTLEGIRYLRSARNVLFVVMTCTLANVFCGPTNAFRPLLIQEVFGGGAAEMGYVGSVSGIGLLLGGFIMSVWKGFRRKLITSGMGWGGVGLFFMLLALCPGDRFSLALFFIFAAGLSGAIGGAPLDAFYQTYVPDELQGRVFSLLTTLDGLTVPIGLVISAIAGDRVPVQVWFFLVGISHFGLFVAWAFSKRLRAAEEVEPPRHAQP